MHLIAKDLKFQPSLPSPPVPGRQPRWLIVIDLRKCNGCQCCVANCSQTNQLPAEAPWRQVANWERVDSGAPRRIFLPLSCMHCANPPCMEVCPTGATFQRPDGIVDINAAHCMGCAYCVVACPYLARTISPAGHAAHAGEGIGQEAGTCVKCNLCAPKLDAGLARGLVPGVDREATPTCAVSCLPGAVQFGDANDPESIVSRLLRENRAVRVAENLGTEPSLYYIVD
jgi:phenylacetyl-CoA:acceptor oxidoreductase subunit 1